MIRRTEEEGLCQKKNDPRRATNQEEKGKKKRRGFRPIGRKIVHLYPWQIRQKI